VSDAHETDAAFPTWDAATIDELRAYGSERAVSAGDVLLQAGRRSEGFYVVLDGEIEVVRPDVECEEPVGVLTPGQFVGGASLLGGQRPFLTARARTDGRVLAIPPDRFRDLMGSRRRVATAIFESTAARAASSRASAAAQTVRIIGSRFSPESLALRGFVTRSRVPHTWVDLDETDDPGLVLTGAGLDAAEVPAVVLPDVTLRNATPGALAERLGLAFESPPGYTFDLVVVGGGPAGLAAAVYGAAEGLDTVALDAIATGGQAGTSSLIENYVGFPNGVSGSELAARAADQARRLGARINAPCQVAALRPSSAFHTLVLSDGSEVPTRAVIVACGAHYRRLDLPDLARYEGVGVYYAATGVEAKGCAERDVIVVGGGNSAGQAALYLAEKGCLVSIVVRRASLAETMSRYLIRRIEADPEIEVLHETVVAGLEGERHLERVRLAHASTGRERTVSCAGLFCFIGAEPATEWLAGVVALDDRGFVLTDRDLPAAIADGPAFAARAPMAYETSVPGVFAVGDVRSGSLKRVASAVGEGSGSVRSVFEHLSMI
jgi:thioredoxin reductase (NADPH)